jgi:hypothetical protein
MYWAVIIIALSYDIYESIGPALPILSPSSLEHIVGQC